MAGPRARCCYWLLLCDAADLVVVIVMGQQFIREFAVTVGYLLSGLAFFATLFAVMFGVINLGA